MQKEIADQLAWLDGIEIGALGASETEDVLDVLSRGMRDNPLTVAAFGEDPEQRRLRLRRFMGEAAGALGWGPNMLIARGVDGGIAGACNATPPGGCSQVPSRRPRMLPSLLPDGPHTAERAIRRLGLSTREPSGRHWRLGPVAVDAHLQGMGVGSLLMKVFCARMEAARAEACLETDKATNVRFFERFGFQVTGEQEVLGVTNWSMLRGAEGRRG